MIGASWISTHPRDFQSRTATSATSHTIHPVTTIRAPTPSHAGGPPASPARLTAEAIEPTARSRREEGGLGGCASRPPSSEGGLGGCASCPPSSGGAVAPSEQSAPEIR